MGSLVFPFYQAWLPGPEPDFHPATAEINLSQRVMTLSATLVQADVITRATAHQQPLWALGDVVELFIQPVGSIDYYEYQIAPNGLMLSLHYPNHNAVAAVRNGTRKMEEFLSELPIEGRASLIPTGWHASLTVPVIGEKFRILCGRYDYSSGSTPIVSSTSPLSKRDFHRVQEWSSIP